MKPRNPHAGALRHFNPKRVADKRQGEKRKELRREINEAFSETLRYLADREAREDGRSHTSGK